MAIYKVHFRGDSVKNYKENNIKGISVNLNIKKKRGNKFLCYAAKQIKPCERTVKDLEEYIIEKYNAVPYELSKRQINALKINVVLNHFKKVLYTCEESKTSLGEGHLIKQAKEYPAENLGLEFKGYKLLKTTSKSNHKEDTIVEIERRSKYFSIENGNREILNDLIIYLGVSKQDIEEKSSRFIQYAHSLKEIGKI